MHFGNCSLHFSNRLPFVLAPNFEMLPMQFMPRGMELTEVDFTPSFSGGVAFEQARTLAQQFWRMVAESGRISDEFKVIAERVLVPNSRLKRERQNHSCNPNLKQHTRGSGQYSWLRAATPC